VTTIYAVLHEATPIHTYTSLDHATAKLAELRIRNPLSSYSIMEGDQIHGEISLPGHMRIPGAVATPTTRNWKPIAEAPECALSEYPWQILCGFQGQFRWVSFVCLANGAATRTAGYAPPTHWCHIPPFDGESE
jgi:hypothetical protein